MQVPVVTTSPAFSVSPRPESSLASQVSASSGPARTFAPRPSRSIFPRTWPGHWCAGEVHVAPGVGRRIAEHEKMRAGIVGDQLRRADGGEILEAGIRNLDRRMERADGILDLRDRIRRGARREIARHAKREFRLGDPHVVGAERQLGAARKGLFAEEPPGERAVDIDVRLTGGARRRDLPAEERRAAAAFEQRLHGVAFGARSRPDIFSGISASRRPSSQCRHSRSDAALRLASLSMGFALAHDEDMQRARAVRAEDQRLLDVGGARWAGDEVHRARQLSGAVESRECGARPSRSRRRCRRR